MLNHQRVDMNITCFIYSQMYMYACIICINMYFIRIEIDLHIISPFIIIQMSLLSQRNQKDKVFGRAYLSEVCRFFYPYYPHLGGNYHLVMTNSLPWKDPPFLIGKPSINGQCSMAMLKNQRVNLSTSMSSTLGQ